MESAVRVVLQIFDGLPDGQIHGHQGIAVDVLIRCASVDAVTPHKPWACFSVGVGLVNQIFERLGKWMPEWMSQARNIELRDVEMSRWRRSDVTDVTVRDVDQKLQELRLRPLREPRRPTSNESMRTRMNVWQHQ